MSKLTKSDVIAIAVTAVLLGGIFLSPKMYLVQTAKWMDWDAENTDMVTTAIGTEHTEERFRLYFQYYNVLHELGHGLLRYNKGVNVPIADEEQLVNDFAVAYWNYYGEPEKIAELSDIANYAVAHIGDKAQKGVDYMEDARAHSGKRSFNNEYFNFNDYGWFQFSCVKHSIEADKSLEEVLHEMGFQNFTLPEQTVLEHKVMSEAESTAIINEAVGNFRSWGLEFPDAYQKFTKDPNENASRPFKNFFGIFSLL